MCIIKRVKQRETDNFPAILICSSDYLIMFNLCESDRSPNKTLCKLLFKDHFQKGCANKFSQHLIFLFLSLTFSSVANLQLWYVIPFI